MYFWYFGLRSFAFEGRVGDGFRGWGLGDGVVFGQGEKERRGDVMSWRTMSY